MGKQPVKKRPKYPTKDEPGWITLPNGKQVWGYGGAGLGQAQERQQGQSLTMEKNRLEFVEFLENLLSHNPDLMREILASTRFQMPEGTPPDTPGRFRWRNTPTGRLREIMFRGDQEWAEEGEARYPQRELPPTDDPAEYFRILKEINARNQVQPQIDPATGRGYSDAQRDLTFEDIFTHELGHWAHTEYGGLGQDFDSIKRMIEMYVNSPEWQHDPTGNLNAGSRMPTPRDEDVALAAGGGPRFGAQGTYAMQDQHEQWAEIFSRAIRDRAIVSPENSAVVEPWMIEMLKRWVPDLKVIDGPTTPPEAPSFQGAFEKPGRLTKVG